MGFIIGMLWGAFSLVLKSLVGRVLLALGISYLTYQGIDLLISSIQSQAFSLIQGLPSEFIGLIGLTKIGEALSVLVSAVTAKYTMQGLTNGSITKMAIK
jgi:hypothetical protein